MQPSTISLGIEFKPSTQYSAWAASCCIALVCQHSLWVPGCLFCLTACVACLLANSAQLDLAHSSHTAECCSCCEHALIWQQCVSKCNQHTESCLSGNAGNQLKTQTDCWGDLFFSWVDVESIFLVNNHIHYTSIMACQSHDTAVAWVIMVGKT